MVIDAPELCLSMLLNYVDTLAVHYYLNSIYLHEISLHADGEFYIKDCKVQYLLEKPGDETKPRAPLSPAFVDAIMACVDSAHSLLDVILGMSIDVLRAIPVVYFVRLSYSVTILIKLSISAEAPSSEIGKILDTESIKANMYLEKLIAHLLNANKPGQCRTATKFLMIILKLKAWYHQATDPSRLGRNSQFHKARSENTQNFPAGRDTKNRESSKNPSTFSSFRKVPSSTPMQLDDFQNFGKYQATSEPLGRFGVGGEGFDSLVSSQSTLVASQETMSQEFQPSILPAFDNSMPVPMDFDPSMFAPFDSMELTSEAIDNWLASDPVFDGLDYGDTLVAYE